MGSKLISKDIIAKGDFENLTEEVKSALAIIQRLQNKY
jgi:2-keto-3-deoxy-6-phosphogluconate aldolase